MMDDEYLVTVFEGVDNKAVVHIVMSHRELFAFLQEELSKEPNIRKLFTVKKIGPYLLDLS